jgi:hypothetical protein
MKCTLRASRSSLAMTSTARRFLHSVSAAWRRGRFSLRPALDLNELRGKVALPCHEAGSGFALRVRAKPFDAMLVGRHPVVSLVLRHFSPPCTFSKRSFEWVHRSSLRYSSMSAAVMDIAESMPDSQHPYMLLVLPDVKDDSVNAPAPAVQQVARGKAKLSCFLDGRATGRKLFKAENGIE